jgi:hypothetical protein
MLLYASLDQAASDVGAALAWSGFDVSFQHPGDSYPLSVKVAEDREADVLDIARAVDPDILSG